MCRALKKDLLAHALIRVVAWASLHAFESKRERKGRFGSSKGKLKVGLGGKHTAVQHQGKERDSDKGKVGFGGEERVVGEFVGEMGDKVGVVEGGYEGWVVEGQFDDFVEGVCGVNKQFLDLFLHSPIHLFSHKNFQCLTLSLISLI